MIPEDFSHIGHKILRVMETLSPPGITGHMSNRSIGARF